MTAALLAVAVLPLRSAQGQGAVSRFAIGLTIVTGLSIGTLFTLFIQPAFYILLARDHQSAAIASEKEGTLSAGVVE